MAAGRRFPVALPAGPGTRRGGPDVPPAGRRARARHPADRRGTGAESDVDTARPTCQRPTAVPESTWSPRWSVSARRHPRTRTAFGRTRAPTRPVPLGHLGALWTRPFRHEARARPAAADADARAGPGSQRTNPNDLHLVHGVDQPAGPRPGGGTCARDHFSNPPHRCGAIPEWDDEGGRAPFRSPPPGASAGGNARIPERRAKPPRGIPENPPRTRPACRVLTPSNSPDRGRRRRPMGRSTGRPGDHVRRAEVVYVDDA